jgi:selenocysteine-specific elongation factor
LAAAQIIRTIAARGIGIPELKNEIGKLLQSISARQDKGKPRLFIDRVFTLAGKGTVVTGTLTGGSFRRGERVEILPLKKEARIRSLQTHKKEIETGLPGSRLALNLTDVEKENLSRGNVLVQPGTGVLTSRMAVRVKVLPHFILGTQEIPGYVSLFDKKEIAPGMEDWAVFRFSEPLCAHCLDRFIIRLPSPALTLGGGKVYDPFFSAPAKKELEAQLAVLLSETPEAWVRYRLAQAFSFTFSELEKGHSFGTAELQKDLSHLQSNGEIEKLAERFVSRKPLEEKVSLLKKETADYHRRFPQRPGLRVAEAGRLLNVSEEEGFLVCDYLVSSGGYARRGPFVSEAGFEPSLTEAQRDIAQNILKRLTFSRQRESAHVETMRSDEENEVLHFLLHSGQLVDVSSDFFLPKNDFENLVFQIRSLIQADGKTTAGRVRDSLGASRKLVIPLLEKLDALGITRRVGDERVLAE